MYILAVDSNQRNLELLSQVLVKEGFEVVQISSMATFAQAAERADQIGLALVDISGFDRSIWDYCEQLSNQDVPLMVISPQRIAQIQRESASHGAQGVLYKPLGIKDLISVVHSMFRGDGSE